MFFQLFADHPYELDETELSEAGLFDGVTWIQGSFLLEDELDVAAADEIADARVSL